MFNSIQTRAAHLPYPIILTFGAANLFYNHINHSNLEFQIQNLLLCRLLLSTSCSIMSILMAYTTMNFLLFFKGKLIHCCCWHCWLGTRCHDYTFGHWVNILLQIFRFFKEVSEKFSYSFIALSKASPWFYFVYGGIEVLSFRVFIFSCRYLQIRRRYYT